MTPTRLYLVRHGATELTAEDRFSGSVGVDLSAEGRRQAARLGERLRAEALTAIYSSPLSRALDTARLVAGECALPVETRDGLRDATMSSARSTPTYRMTALSSSTSRGI